MTLKIKTTVTISYNYNYNVNLIVWLYSAVQGRLTVLHTVKKIRTEQ